MAVSNYEIEVYTNLGIKTYPLQMTNKAFIIGSSAQCDLCLNDSDYVSHQHAAIYYNPEYRGYVLYDLESINGIYTQDGRKIKQIVIIPDLQINIADVRICFKKYEVNELYRYNDIKTRSVNDADLFHNKNNHL